MYTNRLIDEKSRYVLCSSYNTGNGTARVYAESVPGNRQRYAPLNRLPREPHGPGAPYGTFSAPVGA